MAGTAAKMDIFARGAVIVAAMAATKVVDGLAGEVFRGKSGAGDDDLAVFVLVSGVGGLESGHSFSSKMGESSEFAVVGTQPDCEFCSSHAASSASAKSPAASA